MSDSPRASGLLSVWAVGWLVLGVFALSACQSTQFDAAPTLVWPVALAVTAPTAWPSQDQQSIIDPAIRAFARCGIGLQLQVQGASGLSARFRGERSFADVAERQSASAVAYLVDAIDQGSQTQIGGLAYPFKPVPFAVIARHSPNGDRWALSTVLAHELGHLLGLFHDPSGGRDTIMSVYPCPRCQFTSTQCETMRARLTG